MAELTLALGVTYSTFSILGTSGFGPGVTVGLAYFYSTGSTGLRIGTGSILPVVTVSFTLGGATYFTGLGVGTGSGLPIVAECLALGYATAISLTGLRIKAGCLLPIVTERCNGLEASLVATSATGFVCCVTSI